MRNGQKITIGLSAIAFMGVIIYFARKRKQERIFSRLDRIAEEGYETAGDILYPLKHMRSKKNPYLHNDFSSN